MRVGPRCFGQDSSCPALLRWRPRASRLPLRGFHPLRPAFPRRSGSLKAAPGRSYYPAHASTRTVWAPPFSLAATRGIDSFFLLLRVLRCFSSPGSPRPTPVTGLQPAGLPHSEMRGSIHACRSPRLFAACRVLLRLRKPRHPPSALFSLLSVNLLGHLCPRMPMKLRPAAALWPYDHSAGLLTLVFSLLYLVCFLPLLSRNEPFRLPFLHLTSPSPGLQKLVASLLMNSPFFRNGLQRYGLFLYLQIFLQLFFKNIFSNQSSISNNFKANSNLLNQIWHQFTVTSEIFTHPLSVFLSELTASSMEGVFSFVVSTMATAQV